MVRIATGTMGYKHRALDAAVEARKLAAPNFLLKIIPHVDGTARICELVRFHCEEITVKGASTGPAALDLYSHALAPVAELPVLQVLAAKHIVADLTLGLGSVVHDYLARLLPRGRAEPDRKSSSKRMQAESDRPQCRESWQC